MLVFRVGKIIASFFAIFAISFFALPAVRHSPEVSADVPSDCSQRAFLVLDSHWKFNRNNDRSISLDRFQRRQHWSKQRGVSTRVHRTLHVMQRGIFIYMSMIRNTPPHHPRRLRSPLLTIIKHSEVNEKSTLTVNFNRRWFLQRKQRRNFDIYVYQLAGARADRNVRVKRNHQIIRRHSWSMKVEVQRPRHRTPQVERREKKRRAWDDLCSFSHRILSDVQSWTWWWRFRRGTDQIIIVSPQWSRELTRPRRTADGESSDRISMWGRNQSNVSWQKYASLCWVTDYQLTPMKFNRQQALLTRSSASDYFASIIEAFLLTLLLDQIW